MLSRAEAQALRTQFWTAFGRLMTRNISAFGPKTKWLNYRTGIKGLFFRVHADTKVARVSIDLQHSDSGIRELFYEQLLEVQNLLHSTTETTWEWIPEMYLETGQCISRVFVEKTGLNLYDQATWTDYFEFFEQHLVGFDEIWSMVKPIFEDLES